MAKSRKKSNELNEDDYLLIRSILVKIGSLLYEAINSSPSPEDFAKAQLRLFKKKNSLALLWTYFRIDLDPGKLNRPGDMNKQMAQILTNQSQNDAGDITILSNNSKRNFISPSRMSEMLRSLEDSGLFSHIDSRKEIGNAISRGKRELYGRPSAYKLSLNATKIMALLSKPEAIEIIIRSLEESGLLNRLIKDRIMAFLYAVKYASEQELNRLFRIVSGDDVGKIKVDVEFYIKIRPSLDKSLIEQIAEQVTEASAQTLHGEKHNYLSRLFLFIGISKI